MATDTFLESMKQNLGKILDTMEIPEMRKQLRTEDLLWISRNVHIWNGNHPKLGAVQSMTAHLLRSIQ